MIRRRLFSIALYVVALGLLTVAGVMAWGYFRATTSGDLVPPSETVTTSTSEPSERTPPSVASDDIYTVAASHPRALAIDAIGVMSFVQPVGVDQFGQIAVPSNVHFTGWYVKSALPGDAGVTIIDGHVGGRYGGAVFSDLSELVAGDDIRIEKGDRTWLTYRVEQSLTINPDDSTALFKKYTTTESELHLVTCDGVYVPSTQSYDQRNVIIARLIDQV